MTELRMPDLNKTFIAGRLVRDAELKYTAGSKQVCKMTIANTTYYKDGNGERQESTVFVDVTAWGATAEYAAALSKGRPVLIEGALKENSWTDKATGTKRSKIEINASRITPLDWTNDDSGNAPKASPRPAQNAQPQPEPEDDIPF